MKGKKLVFAVILSLIVCLLLVPSAYADTEEQPTDNNSEDEIVIPDNPTNPDGDNGGSNPDPQNNESKDESTDSGDSESKSDNDSAPENEEQSGENASDPDTDKNGDEGGNSELGDNSNKDKNTNGEDESTDDDDTSDDDAFDNENNNANEDGEGENNSENDTDSSSNPNPDSGATPPQPDSTSSFMVDFSYNGKSYKLEDLKGNEQFGLADILKELGIEGNIESAQGDADDLFSAENAEDGWKVTTKKAFSSKQTMTVTVDGIEYVLSVIDDCSVSSADELQGFINDENTDKKFYLTADIEGCIVIPAGKTITIDLKGKTFTSIGTAETKTNITNFGNLTIIDTVGGGKVINTHGQSAQSSEANVTGAAIMNFGTARLVAGTYSREGSAGYSIINQGTMTIEKDVTVLKGTNGADSGTCITNGWYYANNKTNGYMHSDYGDAYLTINGGTIGRADKFPNEAVKNCWYGHLVINGGVLTGSNSIHNYYDCEINGGELNFGIHNENAGSGMQLVIKGGKINGYAPVYSRWNSSAVLSGGVFNGKIDEPHFKPNADDNHGKSAVTVNGGLYIDKAIANHVDDDAVITKCGDFYAVNESGYEFAKSGNTVEIVKAPEGAKIDNVPAGVTVKNSTNSAIIVNGVSIAPGESYTTVAPVTESAVVACEAPVIKYWVVEGKDQTWTKGSGESLAFMLNSNGVVKVFLDGEEVDFELNEDGEIVISAEVLEALEAGEHTVEFVFADGSCKTDIFVK